MTKEEGIAQFLRATTEYGATSDVRVSLMGNGTFIAECAVDGQDHTLVGKLQLFRPPRIAVSYNELAAIEAQHQDTFQAIYRDVLSRVKQAEEAGEEEFTVFRENRYPHTMEEFRPNATIWNLVKQPYLQVWHVIADMLRLCGYDLVLVTRFDDDRTSQTTMDARPIRGAFGAALPRES